MKKNMVRLFTGSLLAMTLMVHAPINMTFASEMDEAVVEQTVAVVETAPAPAPAVVEAPAPAPAVVEAPAPAPAPVETPAPVEAPATVETPAAEETPAPVETSAPVETPAPTEEPVHQEAPTTVEEPDNKEDAATEAEAENVEIKTEETENIENTTEEIETLENDTEETKAIETEAVENEAVENEAVETEAIETEIGTVEVDPEERKTEEAETELPKKGDRQADASQAKAQQTELEQLEIPVHQYSSQVAFRDVKVIRLTENKAKRIITEYLSNGWRIVTTQYIMNGAVVDQAVYNQVDERKEIQEENERETRELERILKEKADAQRALEQEKIDAQRALEQEKIDAQKAQEIIDNKLHSININDLLKIYAQISKGERVEFVKEIVYEVNEVTSVNYNITEDDAINVLKSVYKNIISGTVKSLPGSDYYGDVITGLINSGLGLQPQQTDIQKVIENGNEKLHTELMRGFSQTQRNINNYGTLKEYGTRLDEFTDYAKMRANGILEYKTNDAYNDVEKTVLIANLIGASDEWFTGANNGNIMKSLASAAEVFKGQTNTDDRDLFNIIYDINKETSLFAGEAMAKSQEKIDKAVSGFVSNCSIVLECLRAHETIANYTDEQVQALDSQTRAIYDRIHTNNNTVASKIRELVAVFLGDKEARDEHEKYGILDKAGQYYAKSKTTYIDFGNNGDGIRLKEKLTKSRGRDYIQKSGYTDLEKIYRTATANGRLQGIGLFGATEIDKIAAHAAEYGMSTKDYLRVSGFDTENMVGNTYLLAGHFYDPGDVFLGFKTEADTEGARIYNMNEKGNNAINCILTRIGICMEYGIVFGEELYGNMNENVCFMNFEAE